MEAKMARWAQVATGRGLPTERRPFLGAIGESGELIPGGLYLDYARLTWGPIEINESNSVYKDIMITTIVIIRETITIVVSNSKSNCNEDND